jgi:hypothetical protein
MRKRENILWKGEERSWWCCFNKPDDPIFYMTNQLFSKAGAFCVVQTGAGFFNQKSIFYVSDNPCFHFVYFISVQLDFCTTPAPIRAGIG